MVYTSSVPVIPPLTIATTQPTVVCSNNACETHVITEIPVVTGVATEAAFITALCINQVCHTSVVVSTLPSPAPETSAPSELSVHGHKLAPS